MNLRFPKSLIAALKNRAAAEAVPVNTLAERLLQHTLATSVAGDEYRALCAAPTPPWASCTARSCARKPSMARR
ncbi:hypothetical protein [Serratia sp. ser-z]